MDEKSKSGGTGGPDGYLSGKVESSRAQRMGALTETGPDGTGPDRPTGSVSQSRARERAITGLSFPWTASEPNQRRHQPVAVPATKPVFQTVKLNEAFA